MAPKLVFVCDCVPFVTGPTCQNDDVIVYAVSESGRILMVDKRYALITRLDEIKTFMSTTAKSSGVSVQIQS